MRYLAVSLLAALAACTSARLPVAGLATPASTSLAGAAAGTGKVEVIGGDEAGLRDFLTRWFSPGAYGAPETDTTIWIGQLPPQPPLLLPVPEGARVIGSMEGPYAALEILLEVDQTFAEVRRFYQGRLPAAGWKAPEDGTPGGGFVDMPFELDAYCLDAENAYLTLTGRETETGPTDVRLSLAMPAEYTPCSQDAGQPPDAYRLLPALTSPAGAQTRSGGAGSGDGYAEASTTLRTSLSPAEVLDHYNAQLAAADWKLASSESAETFAWSTWTAPETEGQAWNGMLLILRTPGEDGELYALLRLTQAG